MVVPRKLRSFYIPSVVRQYVHHLQPRLWKTCRKKESRPCNNSMLFCLAIIVMHVMLSWCFFLLLFLLFLLLLLLLLFFCHSSSIYGLCFHIYILLIIDNFVNLRAKILSAFQSSAFIHFYIVFLLGTLAVTNRKADADSSTRIWMSLLFCFCDQKRLESLHVLHILLVHSLFVVVCFEHATCPTGTKNPPCSDKRSMLSNTAMDLPMSQTRWMWV